MRAFNDREKTILRQIQEAGKNGTGISIHDFLQKLWFSAKSQRALIIQTQGHYAVFFLAPAVFDDEKKNNEEVKLFFELVSLLNYLYRDGYITIYRERTELLYFFQETFSNEKTSNNTILLNASGDYTFSPDTIHDRNKNVIYKGIVFNTDIFNLILNSTTGVMIPADSFSELLQDRKEPQVVTELPITPAPAAPVKNKPSPVFTIGLLVSVLGFLLLGTACFMLYEKSKRYDEHFKTIAGNDTLLRNTITGGFTDLKKTIHETAAPVDGLADAFEYLHGIDISKWNGNAVEQIDPGDSISFIICKATEGISGIDPDFFKNWQIIKDKKCILGAYHFYLAGDDPLKQAEHFMEVVDSKGKTDLPLIIDIEQQSINTKKPVNLAVLHKNLLLFLTYIEKRSNRKPMIYTDVAFADTYLLHHGFSNYALWLADYTNAESPRVPVTWKEKGYKIWQKRDNYFIDTHAYDFDVYHGKPGELCQ